jgi:hypothetical protein
VIAHVAGVPVEEILPLVTIASGAVLMARARQILERTRRWLPRRYS